MLILFVDNFIQEWALLVGQLLKIYHMLDSLIFKMVTKNQFSEMMLTTALTPKMLLLLALEKKTTRHKDITDWQIQKTLLRDQELSREFGVEQNL